MNQLEIPLTNEAPVSTSITSPQVVKDVISSSYHTEAIAATDGDEECSRPQSTRKRAQSTLAPAQQELPYRRDLDGLRAIAVLPVVFFHLGWTWFPGGFVGVDIFFVLSGFFMARTILNDLNNDAFSFAAFYFRRMRRIFPVLFSMIFVSCIASWFLFMPSEFRYFAKSVRSAVLFFANVLFAKESGYFDIASELKPLLHTWSLSIEEQFYLGFPLVLFFIYKNARKYLVFVTSTIIALSFGASYWATSRTPENAFYLLQFRVWELLIGSVIAYLPQHQRGTHMIRVMSAAGFIGILIPIFLYSRETPFPGTFALLPCLSTALLIYARPKSGMVALLLTSSPVVFIGRISYSLYIWHWPLIVFYRSASRHPLSPLDGLVALALSFACAYLSWLLIEQPSRYGRWSSAKILTYGLSGGAIFAGVCFAVVVTRNGGFPQRLPTEAYQLYAATHDRGPFYSAPCFADTKGNGLSVDAIRAGKLCKMGHSDLNGGQFLVWGDSHAGAIGPAIDKSARENGVAGLFVGRASCPPLPGTSFDSDKAVKRCGDYYAAVMELIKRERFPYVFLIGYWPKYVHRAELPQQGAFFDVTNMPVLKDESGPIKEGLDKIIEALNGLGSKVILVMDVPEMGYDVPEALARAKMDGRSMSIAPSLEYTRNRQALARRVLELSASKNGALLVDPLEAICGSAGCKVMIGDTVLYSDGDHLSGKGALAISPVFDPVFNIIKTGR